MFLESNIECFAHAAVLISMGGCRSIVAEHFQGHWLATNPQVGRIAYLFPHSTGWSLLAAATDSISVSLLIILLVECHDRRCVAGVGLLCQCCRNICVESFKGAREDLTGMQ